MSGCGDMHGTPVSEAEVAAGLGFTNVHELRRWQTDLGHRVSELEAKVREVQGDADRFKWEGQRMQLVLEECTPVLRGLKHEEWRYLDAVPKLLLAISVVCGKGVDWNNELDDWLKRIK